MDLGNHEEPFEDCDSSDSDDPQFSFSDPKELQIWEEDSSVTDNVYDVLINEDDITESDKINEDASSIVSGMSFLVVFFHLVYRASERSMRTLLIFFQILFQFLAKALRNPLLQQVSLRLPSTKSSLLAISLIPQHFDK